MKCASTWVSECLRQHPEVLLSNPKETDYFTARTGAQGYRRFFTGAKAAKAVGEFTPSYLPNAPYVAKRIFDTLGPVQILAILRDPIRRYISHYKWVLGRREDIDRRSFSRLTLAAFEQANSVEPRLLEFGHYRAALDVYRGRFGSDNTHILVYGDIGADAGAVVRGLYEFLGVDPSFVPTSLEQRVRPGYVPRSALLEWAKVKGYFLVKHNAPWAIDPLKRMRLEVLLERVNAARDQPLVIEPEVIQALRTYYAEEIGQMRELLGRPLSEWG
jgi:hypothetical protein